MADLSSLLGAAGIGGAIGKAIVSLELDTKKYQAELRGAQAQTIASTNASSSAFGNFGALASKALLSVGVAAVAGAAVSVKAAIEANEAHLKLQNTFANNAMLSDSSVEAFERQADALRDLTGVDDEAIISGQALLGQFDLTGGQVMELTPLVVDLSAKLGIDLDAAFKAAGKAATGNTGALARYIGAIEVGKTSAETFANVVDKLGRAQGFAAARAEAEPWRVIGEQFEEIAETIGQQLLPVIQDLSQIIIDNIGVVEAAAEKFAVLIDIYKDVAAISFTPWEVGGDVMRELGGRIDELGLKLPGFKEATDVATGGIERLAVGTEKAIHKIKEFGNVGKKEFDDFKSNIEDSIDTTVGEFEKLNDAFSVTPKELQKQLDLAIQIARREQRTLREIFASDDLTKAQKEALANLPADMRDAWARAGKEGKNQIEKNAVELQRLSERTATEITHRFGEKAKSGGKVAGGDLVQGIIDGLRAFAPGLYSTVDQIVTNALAAARAAAGAKSPSKKMHELGIDMMIGLANGISDAEQKAIDAARKALEKVIDDVSSALDKIKGKASSFRDTIRGAFSEFANIGGAFGSAEEGMSLSDVITSQVAGASVLADVLEALKRQGASKGLLSQVAQSGATFGQALLAGGPQQIEEANAALKTIAELSQQTGKALSEAFFGDKIDRLESQLERVNNKLDRLADLEKEGHSHDIVMDGEKVAHATRDNLVRTGSRNTNIFGGRA